MEEAVNQLITYVFLKPWLLSWIPEIDQLNITNWTSVRLEIGSKNISFCPFFFTFAALLYLNSGQLHRISGL